MLAYPLRVSSAMECLKVTLSEAVYYLSYSVETETEMFMNRGCYVSYFATFIFVTISSSFHNFFMERVYHTKTFDFRMWKIMLWQSVSENIVLLDLYCRILCIVFTETCFFIATVIAIYPVFLLFSGEIERENWPEMGYVQRVFIPSRIFNKTISSQTKKFSDFQ